MKLPVFMTTHSVVNARFELFSLLKLPVLPFFFLRGTVTVTGPLACDRSGACCAGRSSAPSSRACMHAHILLEDLILTFCLQKTFLLWT